MMARVCVGMVAVLAACSSIMEAGTGGTPELRLGAGGELFVRDSGTGTARVPFQLENRGATTVRVPRCGNAVVVEALREEGSSWAQYSAAPCPANLLMTPLALAPGATVDGTWPVHEAGRYRLRVVAGCDCELRIGYPAESRPFEIR